MIYAVVFVIVIIASQVFTILANMKSTDSILLKIDELLLQWGDEKSLFNGGCCTAAYEVARLLDAHMIPYELLIFADRSCNGMKSPEKICQASGCYHMAIVVNYQGQKCSLGVDERFDALQTKFGAITKVFKKVNAERIKNLGDLGELEGDYDHSCDNELRNELEKIFKDF